MYRNIRLLILLFFVFLSLLGCNENKTPAHSNGNCSKLFRGSWNFDSYPSDTSYFDYGYLEVLDSFVAIINSMDYMIVLEVQRWEPSYLIYYYELYDETDTLFYDIISFDSVSIYSDLLMDEPSIILRQPFVKTTYQKFLKSNGVKSFKEYEKNIHTSEDSRIYNDELDAVFYSNRNIYWQLEEFDKSEFLNIYEFVEWRINEINKLPPETLEVFPIEPPFPQKLDNESVNK